ncbi:MAG: GyrI-like domain-containing protein [Nitrosomonadales bacterium]|nr:GyrI-like domain-containing protein [Nitrosomonadales bacterium]
MEKFDLKKELKLLYQPSAKEVARLDVPAMNFLMSDGEGDPNTAPAFAEATEALFAVSYTLKFMVKKSTLAIDYGVMPLEGLWWTEDMAKFSIEDKSGWKWTLMIAQPAFVSKEMVDTAIAEVKRKKNPNAISRLRFDAFTEGECAQILHIGPFSAEGPTIAKVHRFIEASGYMLRGKHHEIYLSDIRKAAPEKWKTVIRQPMQIN